MHFHLPKPLHGWREFAGEIAIIVIGVLIALGAEYLIEQWHWRQEADTANDAFRDELGSAGGVAYERLIIQPCLQSRIRDLSNRLGEATDQWKASPLMVRSKLYLNVMPVTSAFDPWRTLKVAVLRSLQTRSTTVRTGHTSVL